nr:diacylglycerol kinase [Pseudomonadota bacterium]
MRIGLLNNLRAGRNDAQVERLLGFLRRHPDIVHAETNSADVVPEALADLARQEVDILVVNGGDCTLQYALTEILEHQAFDGRVPMNAPLPGG